MKALIKLGGTLLDAPELRASLAAQIAAQSRRGMQITVVHGGGKQMTRFLAERGIESRFVNGLRVTTPETMDAVLKVLAGSVNQELVAALIAAGARAVGLSGVDGDLVEAEQMDPATRVGGPRACARIRRCWICWSRAATCRWWPASRAAGMGRMYNVNADQMAAACAAGWRADRLIFLTDIAGVLDAAGIAAACADRARIAGG